MLTRLTALLPTCASFAIAATFVIVVAAAPSAIAQVEGSAPFSSAGTTSENVDAFLTRLQKAVANDDRAAVAKLVAYPLRAWHGQATVSVRNRQEFLAQYPKIFTASLKQTIAAAKVEQAFANWQGVMFDSGRFWIRPDDAGTLEIVTINRGDHAPAEKKP
jgi:hypothetical protein